MYRFLAVLGLLVLVGAGCASDTPSTTDESPSESASESSGGALSFDRDMTCEWSSPDGTGTSYIKADKVRTETNVDGMMSNILAAGDDCVYIWEEGAADGLRFCYSADVEGDDPFGYESYSEDVRDSAEGTAEEDPNFDINCRNSNLNDSLFTPPSDVNFSNPLEELGL